MNSSTPGTTADPITVDLLADEIAESLAALYTDAGEQPPTLDRPTLMRVAAELFADGPQAGDDDGEGGFITNTELLDEFAEWSPYTNPKDGRQGAKSGGGRVVYGAAAQKALGAAKGEGGAKPKTPENSKGISPSQTTGATKENLKFGVMPFAGFTKDVRDTGDQFAKSLTDEQLRWSHKKHVAAALAAGKPVPPEVLADYPDLAKKHAPTKPQTSKPIAATSPPATPHLPPADVAAIYHRSGTTALTSEINAAVRSAAAMTKPQATETLRAMGFKHVIGDPRRQLAKEIVGRRENQIRTLNAGVGQDLEERGRAAFAKIDDEKLIDVDSLLPPPVRKPVPAKPPAAKVAPPPPKPKPTPPPRESLPAPARAVADLYDRGATATKPDIDTAMLGIAKLKKAELDQTWAAMGMSGKPKTKGDALVKIREAIDGRAGSAIRAGMLRPAGTPPASESKPITPPPVHDTLDKLAHFMPQGAAGSGQMRDFELTRTRQRDYNVKAIAAAKSRPDFADVTSFAKQAIDDAANKNRSARITIPQLSEVMKAKYPDLTVPQLHGVLSNLADSEQIYMMPWTLPRDKIPTGQVQFALPKDLEIKFYLDKRTKQ